MDFFRNVRFGAGLVPLADRALAPALALGVPLFTAAGALTPAPGFRGDEPPGAAELGEGRDDPTALFGAAPLACAPGRSAIVLSRLPSMLVAGFGGEAVLPAGEAGALVFVTMGATSFFGLATPTLLPAPLFGECRGELRAPWGC